MSWRSSERKTRSPTSGAILNAGSYGTTRPDQLFRDELRPDGRRQDLEEGAVRDVFGELQPVRTPQALLIFERQGPVELDDPGPDVVSSRLGAQLDRHVRRLGVRIELIPTQPQAHPFGLGVHRVPSLSSPRAEHPTQLRQ